MLVVLLFACSADSTAIAKTTFETCAGQTYELTVETTRIPIGPSSNAVRKFGDTAYVVESGSNTISRLTTAGKTDFADVGNDRNPWDVWADEDEVWVTNFLANTVSVFDTNGQLLAEIENEAFENPSAILGIEGKVYVTQVAFRGENYGGGSVVQIDQTTKTVEQSISTSQVNPQFLSVVEHNNSTFLAVVNSGAFDLSDAGAFVKSDGALELWSIVDGEVVDQQAFLLPIVDDRRIGSASEAHQVFDSIYLGSGTAPVMFKFDLDAMAWSNGTDSPLRIDDVDSDALHRTTVFRDLIWVTAFNSDEMLVFDPSCDKTVGRITVDDSSILAGPFGAVFFEGQTDFANFILSNANALGRIEIAVKDHD